jgi:4-hydroxyphenylacetate decarboxylase small subunit
MTTSHNHRDCRNFAAVDVSKGICHRSKQLVAADDSACEQFDRIPKCVNCLEFAATATELGICNASSHEPKFFAYPDMVASTCDRYRER